VNCQGIALDRKLHKTESQSRERYQVASLPFSQLLAVVPASPTIEQLKWALQTLALPADLQLQQFPDFVVVTDELMLEFDNWRQAAAGAQTFTPDQQVALEQLDRLFDRLCSTDDPELATEAALREHPRWEEVRQLANNALETFGWCREIPPKERLAYIRGHERPHQSP
jgi:hypothetical protein